MNDFDKHPVQISVAPDDEGKTWACLVIAENFETKADAEVYADRVKEFLEDEAGGEFLTAQ